MLKVPLGDARKALASAIHEQQVALGQLRTKAQPKIPVFKVPDDPDEEALSRAMGVAPAAVCEAADQHGIEFHNGTRIRRAADGSLMITDRTNAKGSPLPDLIAVHNGHLKIEGMIRTGVGDGWGRLVSWTDSDGQQHSMVLKVSDLEGDAIEVRKELASKGLIIGTDGPAAQALVHFLKLWPAPARVRSVTKLGWSGSSFVTPGQCFGAESAERVVYAPEGSGVSEADFAHAGSVSEWIERVGVPSLASTRITLAISAAFAAPLLKLLNQEGGAVHLHGASSAGKSTALICAASVYGPPSLRVKGWRSTSNGLEGVAAGHNDLPLVLDEMGTVSPSEVGQISYMLSNGQGKIRATKTGGSRAPYTWRTLVLSSGEVTMRTVMGRAKVTVDAGMEVRMLSVPVDGLAHGVFETLPLGCPDGATASQTLKTGAAECHGTVGAAWLSWLATHPDAAGAGRDLVSQITQQLHEAHPGLSAQAGRGLGRFAIIAAGGELATRAGLTGWAEGDATRAVAACVGAWLDGMDGGGTDQLEDVRGVDLVRDFLQTQAARFLNREDADKSEPTKVRVHNCAGYLDKNAFKQDFLVFPGVFSGEICRGYDPKRIAAALKTRGFLIVGADGKHSKPVTVGGAKSRFYVISGTIMEETDN